MKMKILLAFTFFISATCQASAATCSSYQLASYARTLAEKELAAANLAIAKQRVLLELENQSRITAAMEQQFQASLLAANSLPATVRTNAVALLQSAFATSRNKQSKSGNLTTADANRMVRSAQLRFDSANRSAARTLSCDAGPGSTGPGTVLPPTVSLEGLNIRTGVIAKNGESLLVYPGDSIQYRWSALGAVAATSSYRITAGPNTCGWVNPSAWFANMQVPGAELATVQACQKGSTYEITFRPTNALGVSLGEQKLIVVVQ